LQLSVLAYKPGESVATVRAAEEDRQLVADLVESHLTRRLFGSMVRRIESQRRRPEKNAHCEASKAGGWVYTTSKMGSKMEIPAYSGAGLGGPRSAP